MPTIQERNAQMRSEFKELTQAGHSTAFSKRCLAKKYGLGLSQTREILRTDIAEEDDRIKPRISLSELEYDDDRIVELVKAENKVKQLSQSVTDLNKRMLMMREQMNDQQKRLELFEHLQSNSSSMVINVSPDVASEAVAIVQASDWHVGEFVHPEKVNYWNKYNPDIAEHSANLFFDRTIKLLRKEQKDVQISKIVLHLGGDMMTGHIHEELKESTAFSPNEEAQFAKYLLTGGISNWLNEVEELFVVCNYGNHGRNNPEKKISTGAENSYEWAMYHDIARHFENEPRIKFLIPRGEWCYVDVGKYKLRFTHLDSVRYVGGVGGISIPLIKAIHNWNSAEKADMTFGGHFHQRLINEQIGFSVNNCLMGINAYGLRYGRPTRATQNFQLLDLKRDMFTTSLPIICDDGDRVNRHTSYPGVNTKWQSTNAAQDGMIIPG